MSIESQITGPSVPLAASRLALELGIEKICSRQKQLIRLEQLVELGLSVSGVEKRVARRRIHRLHRGVFALHPPPYSRRQVLLAATFACGHATFGSDFSAAHLLGMSEDAPPVPHVTNGSGVGRTLRGIIVHQRALDPRDATVRHGIPCTTSTRTILDCAVTATIEDLEGLLMAADSGRPGLDRSRLQALIDENGGRRGIRNLRTLISDDPKETRSINERRMLKICRRWGVPEPRTGHEIRTGGRTFYADFCWLGLRLIVEADSWRWHGGRLKVEADRDRDQLLAIAGWQVVHFTRNRSN